jgi:dUTP pyrophosphatase
MNTSKMKVKILFLRAARALYSGPQIGPAAATAASAGFDLRADLPAGSPVVIEPGERAGIPTGIAIESLRDGVAGFVYSRSGLGAVRGLTVAQGVGLIDPDYRGEIQVFLLNTGREAGAVSRGDRIAQLVFQPFLQPSFIVADALGETERGAGGFGHTGKQ